MRDARKPFAVAAFAAALVAACTAYAQETDAGSLIAAAERSFPESKIPALFGPGSLSAAFAEEAEDPSWSSATEERILDEIASQYADGLRYKRAQVECRTSTCVLLLSYVAPPQRTDASVRSLRESLREEVGFASAIASQKTVMVQTQDVGSTMIRTTPVSAYVEIVLKAAR